MNNWNSFMLVGLVLIAACIGVMVCGCGDLNSGPTDGGKDGGAVHDGGARDGGSDGGADTGNDAGADGGDYVCVNEYCIDRTTGYWWQDPPPIYIYKTWQEALDYCNNLELGGQSDWHLPSVDELRSLIRGCTVTQTGGSCGVTNSCLKGTCYSSICEGCADYKGPGKEGCYWDAALSGSCSWYWTSSTYTSYASDAWFVGFTYGAVYYDGKDHSRNVRCVR